MAVYKNIPKNSPPNILHHNADFAVLGNEMEYFSCLHHCSNVSELLTQASEVLSIPNHTKDGVDQYYFVCGFTALYAP